MQQMEHHPSKIARLSSGWNMEGNGSISGGPGSPPIGLGLELGCGSGSGHVTLKSSGFTIFQLQELRLQSLIYKYIEAGLAVPQHLLLPIWKSVASSLSGLNSSFFQLYPSILGSNTFHIEHKNGMDPEPGRCRRTDGKKWRCSKEALPEQKYCEKHMHRGRQRSRKLVEAAASCQITRSPAAAAASATSTDLSISLPTSNNAVTGSNFSPRFCSFSPKSVLNGGTQKH